MEEEKTGGAAEYGGRSLLHAVIDVGRSDDERNQSYNHYLSRREMESLLSVCETFLPSISDFDHGVSMAEEGDSTARYYLTSASMAATPQRVRAPLFFFVSLRDFHLHERHSLALLSSSVDFMNIYDDERNRNMQLEGLMRERLRHPKKWLMRVALWLLSTWYGTLILCGYACLSAEFPFFHRFSELPQYKREEIVRSWSLSYFDLLRVFFRTMKLLTLLVFFTQVNEEDDNLSWTAIGYVGPDPDFRTTKNRRVRKNDSLTANHEKSKTEEEDDQSEKETLFGPLHGGLLDLSSYPRERAANELRKRGFAVSLPKSNPCMVIRCDAVVVGSGSGGGVAAGVLSNAGYKVLVLEKGSYCARSNLSLLEGQAMEEMYLSSGLMATDDMKVLILAGSTVGGGSTVNWSSSIKTPKCVRKEWSETYGLELFESRLYRDAMDAVCEKMGVQSEIDEEGFNNAVLRRGCEELGYPVNSIPRNSAADHYCGWCCMGCKDGKKKGTAETWLVDLVKSGNGAILPVCEAIKVLHQKREGRERREATGVAFRFGNGSSKDICVVQSQVTIVAAGALSTPPLLKRSGLKNPNIGKNLHLHPVVMAWGYFPETGWPEKEKRSYEGGIMTAMSTATADPDGSGYGAIIQTPALHPGMFSILMPWVSGRNIKDRMSRFSRTAHVFALGRDRGSGTVREANSIGYKMEKKDEENLQMGVEKVMRIMAAAGAEEIGTHHAGGKSIRPKEVSFRELERFVMEESRRPLTDTSTPICSAHQMGSCRMGVEEKNSAVKETGETWEVERLFVADSSVFPTALGVNPMVTVQAIAYCTAQSVLQLLRRRKNS